MPNQHSPYLPAAPLLAYLETHCPANAELRADIRDATTKRGNLEFGAADSLACRAYVHPCLVWGDAYWLVPLNGRREEPLSVPAWLR